FTFIDDWQRGMAMTVKYVRHLSPFQCIRFAHIIRNKPKRDKGINFTHHELLEYHNPKTIKPLIFKQ
ncbi:hypothetical protein OFN64_36865, partial [Escherichia coli]|nr:hypothetical protein [Escherichia coli]